MTKAHATWRYIVALAACAAASCAGTSPALAEADGCYADWSVAAPIVKKEGLASVEDLSKLARTQGQGELLKATLCVDKGRFSYKVVVREANGNVRNLSTDAKKPFGH